MLAVLIQIQLTAGDTGIHRRFCHRGGFPRANPIVQWFRHNVIRPELQVIINSALEHYKKFISRSKDGWERELQNRIETSNKTENVQRIVAPKPPKRGFLSIFGGK